MLVHAIILKDKTKKAELADYLHAFAFSLALPTFKQAIQNNNFVTWAAITTINFSKFAGDKTPMYLGYLDQVIANLQSTKSNKNKIGSNQNNIEKYTYTTDKAWAQTKYFHIGY